MHFTAHFNHLTQSLKHLQGTIFHDFSTGKFQRLRPHRDAQLKNRNVMEDGAKEMGCCGRWCKRDKERMHRGARAVSQRGHMRPINLAFVESPAISPRNQMEMSAEASDKSKMLTILSLLINYGCLQQINVHKNTIFGQIFWSICPQSPHYCPTEGVCPGFWSFSPPESCRNSYPDWSLDSFQTPTIENRK